MLTTSEIMQVSEGNSELSWVTNAFDINNIDVEDTISNGELNSEKDGSYPDYKNSIHSTLSNG